MKSPLRVMIVAPLPPPQGGIATWTEGLLHIASQDSEVDIIHVDSAVRFRSVWNLKPTARMVGGFLHGLALLAQFAWRLFSKRIDVVHITTSGSFGMCRDLLLVTVARFLRKPVVLHMRYGRIPLLAASKSWETVLVKTTCEFARSVIVLDSASAVAIESLAPRCSISVVPNPAWKMMDAPVLPITDANGDVVVFVGWVVPAKGVRELVLACRDIRHRDLRLELIGPVEDKFRDELCALASYNGDARWIKMSGQVESDEALSRIANGSLVALPSYSEGCPNVILEAMMQGKPVVATPVGAIPEMLAFGGCEPCGISVPVGDIHALRTAICSLLDDRDYAQTLGRRARKRVASEYSPRIIFARYISIWRTASFEQESQSA